MKSSKLNEQKGLLGFLKKVWEGIWNSGGVSHDCPDKARSAQEIRDEYQKIWFIRLMRR